MEPVKNINARRGTFSVICGGTERNCLLDSTPSTPSLICSASAWPWNEMPTLFWFIYSWNSCISFILSSLCVIILQTGYSWAAKLPSEWGRNIKNYKAVFCRCCHLPHGSINTIGQWTEVSQLTLFILLLCIWRTIGRGIYYVWIELCYYYMELNYGCIVTQTCSLGR